MVVRVVKEIGLIIESQYLTILLVFRIFLIYFENIHEI